MSDSQPQQGAGGQQGGQPQQLLRADDILKLQCLPDDEKQKYRLIMLNFYEMTRQHPVGSPEHTTARTKIAEWSQKFIFRERQYRLKLKQQQGAQGQGQSSPGNQAGQQNQAQPQVKPEQSQPSQQNGQGASAQQPQQAQQNLQAGAQQQRPAGQNAGIDPAIIKHVQDFPIQLPPNAPAPGTPGHDEKVKEYRNGYLNMLAKQASLAENRRKIVAQMEEAKKNGQEPPQQMLDMKLRFEKEYQGVKDQVEKFRTLQKRWKDEWAQKSGSQAQQGQQGEPQPTALTTTPSQAQQPQTQVKAPTQPEIKNEPQIKIEGGQPPQSQQQAQFNMQGNPQQQQQQQQNPQMPPSLGLQQQVRPPPGPHSQSMPAGQIPQFAPPGQQHMQQQQQARPQINPHQANAHQHQQSNSPHPQSATSGGPPVPLSHQAAVSAANRSYTDPQHTNTPMQQGAQGNFGSREREQLNNPKMPIPRHLNVTSPAPVHMGQARPTMSGPTNGAPGPMGQPVIPRPPPFQLEGEGDRVLSKRKLDELVRQVTGGSEEALTPEVEEAVMQLADDFVDNVISNACKLSKLRESSQLDIRDLQLVLERNYNIRIPGYASDEVRTVRKVVPASGWVDKMKAVNAAKVMGGKADF